ncbi:hypothetical protein PTI45_02537 [Paenibacillus nuruki]|uniref:Uncharacterized protein n=1 Tax=Paenibacillus nuruki TaxID=1886670 RepID=A0A1E3L2U6_9BACL|nr:hypothetical protein PTI45_02537 [Paenibacillus nuruki]
MQKEEVSFLGCFFFLMDRGYILISGGVVR